MSKILHYLNHRNTGLLALALALVGIVHGKFILSVGTILLFARALIHPEYKKHLQLLWKHKAFLCFASIFLLWGLTGFWSENTQHWLQRLQMKLPFVAIPFGLLGLKNFDRKIFDQLMYGFFWLIVFTTIGSILHSFSDYDTILENYKKGQVMPLPTHHIRYSLMIVFCVCFGIYFFKKKYFILGKWEIASTVLATLFLVAFLHFLAVRSGLLALYSVVIFQLIRLLFLKKNKLIGIGLVALFVGGSWLSYQYVPTLRNKVDYTMWSLKLFTENKDIREYSDTRRLGSLIAGYNLTKENPILGVGFGDLHKETNQWFAQNYPDLKDLGLKPHNQFLFISAGAGLVGLVWFLVVSVFPFFYNRNWQDSLFWMLNIVIFTSYLPEHTIETQIGVAIYVFPVLMLMRANLEKEKRISRS